MTLQSLNCPSCGAPLRFIDTQHRVLCLYCGSTIVQTTGAAAPAASQTPALQAEALDELKQYLLDGRRAEALQLYQDKTGATGTEAAETLTTLSRQVLGRTLLEQPISNLGIFVVALVDLAAAGALVWAVPNGNQAVVVVAVLVILLQTLAFARAIRSRVLQELGQLASARVERVVRLGELKVRGEAEPLQAVRLWLEVDSAGPAAFSAEKNFVMRRRSFDQLRPGLVIEVKHYAGQVYPTTPMKILER